MPHVITIGREFGSGGREFGRRLAEEMGWAYYDQEILNEIAKNTDFSKEYIAELSEKKPLPLYPIHYGHSFIIGQTSAFTQDIDVFRAQSEAIKQLAAKRNCVIIGRCADYVLRDQNPIRLFIYADMESKVKRCRERDDKEHLTDQQMAKMIRKVDKRRKAYYEFYTGRRWGARESYDMLINTSNTDIKALAKILSIHFSEEEGE
ncbi:MAG: cytidylate kinase-like family protein [Bacillota bacterium]|nr:cytidylate kinase-like family protein [Bacillota bacterium]